VLTNGFHPQNLYGFKPRSADPGKLSAMRVEAVFTREESMAIITSLKRKRPGKRYTVTHLGELLAAPVLGFLFLILSYAMTSSLRTRDDGYVLQSSELRSGLTHSQFVGSHRPTLPITGAVFSSICLPGDDACNPNAESTGILLFIRDWRTSSAR
jgi:hypothetical protein